MPATKCLKISPESLRFSLYDFKNTFKTDLEIQTKQLSLEFFCGGQSKKASHISYRSHIDGGWLSLTLEPMTPLKTGCQFSSSKVGN